jgi:uncharacterized protein (TIGR00369 family)
MIRSPKSRSDPQTEDSQLPASAVKVPKLSAREVNDFLAEVFPQAAIGRVHTVEETAHGYARLRMAFGENLLRPGGTISGPAMFSLADLSMYAAILASLGPAVSQAATVNLNMTFLRKPGQRDMIGEVRLHKIGRRLAMGEVALYSDGEEDLAAHATSTYALPG